MRGQLSEFLILTRPSTNSNKIAKGADWNKGSGLKCRMRALPASQCEMTIDY
jgi:hypothetical protein